jgi:uncharacterized protein YuzE
MFRKRLVPDAHDLNTVQLFATDSGCCGEDYQKCKYTIAIDTFVDVASITITENGVAKTIAFPATVTTSGGIADAIRAALETEGYILDDDAREVDVTVNGNAVAIDIWGEAVVTKVTEADDTDHSATKKCTKQVRCTYATVVAGGAMTVSVDGGSAESLGTIAYPSNAASVKSAIEGATALSGVSDVVVTENATLSKYEVSFKFKKAEVNFTGSIMDRSACTQDFVA